MAARCDETEATDRPEGLKAAAVELLDAWDASDVLSDGKAGHDRIHRAFHNLRAAVLATAGGPAVMWLDFPASFWGIVDGQTACRVSQIATGLWELVAYRPHKTFPPFRSADAAKAAFLESLKAAEVPSNRTGGKSLTGSTVVWTEGETHDFGRVNGIVMFVVAKRTDGTWRAIDESNKSSFFDSRAGAKTYCEARAAEVVPLVSEKTSPARSAKWDVHPLHSTLTIGGDWVGHVHRSKTGSWYVTAASKVLRNSDGLFSPHLTREAACAELVKAVGL